MIDELIEETLTRMAPAVDTSGVVEAVRHRAQRLHTRRHRRLICVVSVCVVVLRALGIVLARGDERHRVATIDRAGTTGAVAAESSYFVPGWLPEDFVLRSQSISMPCGPQVATSSPAAASCPWALNTTTYGLPGAAPRAVTIAVLRAGAPVTTNAPATVTVRGRRGALDHFERTQGPVQQWILSWSEDDATLLAFNGVDMTDAEMLRIAESLRRTTEAEWQAASTPRSAPSIPDPSASIERARLTTTTGEVVRVVEGVGRSWWCILRGSTSSCSGSGGSDPVVPIDERPAHPTISVTQSAAGFAAYMITMPRTFPDTFTVRDRAGRTIAFTESDARRFVLVVDTDTARASTVPVLAQFDFVAPDGTVIATT